MAAYSAAALRPSPPSAQPLGSAVVGSSTPPQSRAKVVSAASTLSAGWQGYGSSADPSGHRGSSSSLGASRPQARGLPPTRKASRGRQDRHVGARRWPLWLPSLPSTSRPRPLGLLTLLAPLLLASAGCQTAHLRPSWRIYPLPRQMANDGLAVVNQPDGYGLHIWVDTDTSQEGICRPRWNPAAARLFNGNGSTPFSSGLATPAEFYEAVGVGPVRQALRRQIEALCRARAPRSRFVWSEPPRRAADYKPPPLASLEERHLLSDPDAIKRAEQRLLGVPPGERETEAGQPVPRAAKPTAAPRSQAAR